jgi:hypothetical protein
MECNFDMIWLYLNKKLDLDRQLEVLNHLYQCEICFEAMYQISRDRDAAYLRWPAAKDQLAS